MVTKDHEPEPHELVQTIPDKLAQANLTRDQVEKLVPPSLTNGNCHDIPPYEPGAYKKQCEEARKQLEKLENQRLPGFVPQKEQEKYLNEFFELEAHGKISHLSPEMLEKLKEEIKASAVIAKKHAELEEFLSSLNTQAAIPEPQQSVETYFVFESSQLCDTGPLLHTEWKEPRERKGPIKVASRTAQEVLDALNIVTEYIQLNDLEKYLAELKMLEKTLRQKV